MPTERTIATLWRGNTFSETYSFKDESNVAFDLTGSELWFRAEWEGGAISKQLTIATPANGQATLSLSAAETHRVGEGTTYEIERRIGGVETTLLYGEITYQGGVNTDA